MHASSLTFLAELINASVRHLKFLFIDIRFTQTSVITNISMFLTIADNQIDGQNNEVNAVHKFLAIADNQIDSQNNEVNAVSYPVQNADQISKLFHSYYKLSVCLWVDTKILAREC